MSGPAETGRHGKNVTRRDLGVVVIGAGVAGLATARALALTGTPVTVLERFHVGHDRGSSHGRTRMMRLAHPDVNTVREMRTALDAWRALEREADEQLLAVVGALDIGSGLQECCASMQEVETPFDVLDASELETRFGVTVPQRESGVFQPEGGVLHSDRSLNALARSAARAGMELREGVTVRALVERRDGVHIDTSAGPLVAPAVVLAAGPWTSPLAARGGIRVACTPTRETVCYHELRTEQSVPCIVHWTLTEAASRLAPAGAFYALPDPVYGLKAGLHGAGVGESPDASPKIDPAVSEVVAGWLASIGDWASPEPLQGETCYYTNTPDQASLLHARRRIVVGSACNGTGFKFALGTGERLAELARTALRKPLSSKTG